MFEFLALLPLSQVGDRERAIFLALEVVWNQRVEEVLKDILLDMKNMGKKSYFARRCLA